MTDSNDRPASQSDDEDIFASIPLAAPVKFDFKLSNKPPTKYGDKEEDYLSSILSEIKQNSETDIAKEVAQHFNSELSKDLVNETEIGGNGLGLTSINATESVGTPKFLTNSANQKPSNGSKPLKTLLTNVTSKIPNEPQKPKRNSSKGPKSKSLSSFFNSVQTKRTVQKKAKTQTKPIDKSLDQILRDFNIDQTLNLSKIDQLEESEEFERAEQQRRVSELRAMESEIKKELTKRLENNVFNGAVLNSRSISKNKIQSAFDTCNLSKSQQNRSISPFFDIDGELSRIMYKETAKKGSSDFNSKKDVYLFHPIYNPYTVTESKRSKKDSVRFVKNNDALILKNKTVLQAEATTKRKSSRNKHDDSEENVALGSHPDEYPHHFGPYENKILRNARPCSLSGLGALKDTSSRLLEYEATKLFSPNKQHSFPPFAAMKTNQWNSTLFNFISLVSGSQPADFQEMINILTFGFNVKKWSVIKMLQTVFLSAGMEVQVFNKISAFVNTLYNDMEQQSTISEQNGETSTLKDGLDTKKSKSKPKKENGTNSDTHTWSPEYKYFYKNVIGPRYHLPQTTSVKFALHLSCSIVNRVSQEKEQSHFNEPFELLRLLVLSLAALVSVDTSLLEDSPKLDFPGLATILLDSVPAQTWTNSKHTDYNFKHTPTKYQNSFLHRAVSLICCLFSPKQFYLRLRFLDAFSPGLAISGRLAEFHRYVSTAFVVSSIYKDSSNNLGLVSFTSMGRLFKNVDTSDSVLDALTLKTFLKPKSHKSLPFVDFYFDMNDIEGLLSKTILPCLRVDPVFASYEDYQFQDLLLSYKAQALGINVDGEKSFDEMIDCYLKSCSQSNLLKDDHSFDANIELEYLDYKKRVFDAFRMIRMLQYVKDDDWDTHNDYNLNDTHGKGSFPCLVFLTTGIAETRARALFLCKYVVHSLAKVSKQTRQDLVSRFYDIHRGIQQTIQTGIGQYMKLVEQEIRKFQTFENLGSESDQEGSGNNDLHSDPFPFGFGRDVEIQHDPAHILVSDFFLPDAESLDTVLMSFIELLNSRFPVLYQGFDFEVSEKDKELASSLKVYKKLAEKLKSEMELDRN